ncbi:MAG: methylated-DNA--[protein]-cysteine S-methyltransferase [Phycisphaerales bacterium]|nr:methylated-DNA--[protein]-cysteine S-methyltransferase [Phycisphaerales bacterium]MCB9857684.1 methylated-DNA--[protein]-cysteine S-methyltransferase [Phycisphaerales bacterium]MCB9864773.1 methylated-DNA--[protein]-cysteine S-methyltransferase [Phycisphaerales bacterium]
MLARDAAYDGIFIVAVRTTGIFCRPDCPARKPKPENVEFYPSVREALFAGYRACKRCRPMETNGRPPVWIARIIKAAESRAPNRLRDGDLRNLDVDPARARRWFKQHYGMTFHAWQRALRLGTAFARLREGEKVTTVSNQLGYESESGFRDAFEKTFGNAPTAAAKKDCITATMIESPVGRLILGATSDAVCLLEFPDRRALEVQIETLRKRFDAPVIPGHNKWTRAAERQLKEYFARKRTDFELPLDYPGTPFQVQVWNELLKIPYGKTIAYATLAKRIKRDGACRAVGTANGANRIAIIIPCHRVVNAGGKLGGYGGGLWRKQLLLDLEQGADSNQLFG